jgi:hypothetical protein
LLESLQKTESELEYADGKDGYLFAYGTLTGVRKSIIYTKGAPAAVVVEVKHGKWIDKPTGSYGRMQSWCSACGKHSGIGGIESNRHKPYCPNCGAKMDGGN